MTVTIVRGDARHLPLPDASVDLICTSPPYWGLRDYRDGDESLKGQIGAESTPGEYLDALWECTREWTRILKPEGSLFVVLGDKYANRTRGAWRGSSDGYTCRGDSPSYVRPKDLPEKSLIGLPWRYALGCIDQLGLVLRSEIVWSKPSAMPESVTDRVRRSHEQIFHFTSRPRYYSAVDEIREPHTGWRSAAALSFKRSKPSHTLVPGQTTTQQRADRPDVPASHPLGALPGSVWQIATQPLQVPAHLEVDHYAAYPFALVRRIVQGWSPTAICTACGEGRRPVSTAVRTLDGEPGVAGAWKLGGVQGETSGVGNWRFATDRRLTGYACACPTPDATSRPAVVLDPFGGTGTTALIADLHGRHGISIDRSADYCRIAAWRTTDPGERARGIEQPKPKPVRAEPDDQAGLWDDEAIA